MKLVVLLACQVAFGFKIVHENVDLKDVVVRRTNDKIFPFRLDAFDPEDKFTLVIKNTHLEGNKEVHSFAIDGTGDQINIALDERRLPPVIAPLESHRTEVTIKNHSTGHEEKFEYKFKALAHIEVEDLRTQTPAEAAYPLRSHKLPDSLRGKKLRLVAEGDHPDLELTQKDDHIVLNVKNGKPMPAAKFHVLDEENNHRSADLYTLPHAPVAAPTGTPLTAETTAAAAALKNAAPVVKRRITPKTYFYISGVFVAIVLAAIIVSYSSKKKEPVVYEPDRLTMVPGMGNANVPRHISLPVDTYGQSTNILDLKDAHNK